MALGMTYNGAEGLTRDSMAVALELQGLTLDEVNQSYRSLIDLLAGLDPEVQWLLANSIWYREGFPVEQAFLDVNRTYFDAEVAALDFTSPDAAPTINAWVNEKTKGRIPEIVDDPIADDLVMFLINAIYFKGNWTKQFDPDLTGPMPFYLAGGGETSVPTMTHGVEVAVGYYRDADVEVLDLPYGGQAYSMTIVMPAEGTDVGSIVSSLAAQGWQGWIDGLATLEMHVYMPKFRLEYELGMNDVLEALGMGIAFDPFRADFSKIYSGPENLYISRVKHKTFVDVNEEGTEAAAVTSVEVGITSMPPTVYVNRPFIFALREKFSGTILFIGLIMEPVSQ
jgi:serpin B